MAARGAIPWFYIVATAVAEQSCSCEHVATLNAQVASLGGELATLRQLMLDLSAKFDAPAKYFAEASTTKTDASSIQVDANRTTTNEPEPRRLSAFRKLHRKLQSASPTYVSVQSRHVHEFPSSHTCGTVSGYMQFLPTTSGGQVSWNPSPSDVTSNMAIVNVANDWSTTTLDSLASPLRVLHASDCNSAPTAHLQLNTVADGTMTVNGLNIVTALTRPSTAFFPTNLQIGAGTDATRVVLTRATMAGASVGGLRPCVVIEGTSVSGHAPTTATKQWFMLTSEQDSTTGSYMKVVGIQVSIGGGGTQLILNQNYARYKAMTSSDSLNNYDLNAQWNTFTTSVIATAENSNGYGIMNVEYHILS